MVGTMTDEGGRHRETRISSKLFRGVTPHAILRAVSIPTSRLLYLSLRFIETSCHLIEVYGDLAQLSVISVLPDVNVSTSINTLQRERER
jgi:hypothetical protein